MVGKFSKSKNKKIVILGFAILVALCVLLFWFLARRSANTLLQLEKIINRQDNATTLENFLKNYHANNPHLFSKHDKTLTVNLQNNRTVEFTDNSSIDDTYSAYNYLIFIPEINSHLIYEQWYEGKQYVLVSNETGVTQAVWAIPRISPEKNRLAVANKDLLAGYTPNGLQVFELVSGNYIKQFERQLDWGADNPRWLDNAAFSVDKYIFNIKDFSLEKQAGQVVVKRAVDKWVIEK
jgi:hypothetical protein